jgi:hypothetical protein
MPFLPIPKPQLVAYANIPRGDYPDNYRKGALLKFHISEKGVCTMVNIRPWARPAAKQVGGGAVRENRRC